MSDTHPIQNQTILITGATDGIGRQTALELARLGAQVIVHGRSAEKCRTASAEISSAAGCSPLPWVAADLSSLRQVRQMAAEVQQRFPRLNVLINNAGVNPRERILTEDGLELTFAVNHLAPFLLTNLLLDALKANAPARIIMVSSIGHVRTPAVNWDNLQGEQVFKSWPAYCVSKLGTIFVTVELAQRLQGSGVTINALHPGVIDTKLLRDGLGISGAPIENSARTSVYLATSPEVSGVSGKYFDDCQITPYNPLADDAELRHRFWQVSAQLAGLQEAA